MSEQLDTQRYCEGYLGHDLCSTTKEKRTKTYTFTNDNTIRIL